MFFSNLSVSISYLTLSMGPLVPRLGPHSISQGTLPNRSESPRWSEYVMAATALPLSPTLCLQSGDIKEIKELLRKRSVTPVGNQ